MKISEAARQTGLTEKAIRLYEQHGLVHPDTRTVAGRVFRDYPEREVQRLTQIATLRRADFSLNEIAALLEAGADSARFSAVLGEWSSRARTRIARLQSALDALDTARAAPADLAALAALLAAPTSALAVPTEDLHFSPLPAHAPTKLSFWYRHGLFPHHLKGLALALTSLLWEKALTAEEIDRALRKQNITIDRRRLSRELARLTRRDVLTCTDGRFAANVYTGIFAELQFEDVFNLLATGDPSCRMLYSNLPPTSVSSRGPGMS